MCLEGERSQWTVCVGGCRWKKIHEVEADHTSAVSQAAVNVTRAAGHFDMIHITCNTLRAAWISQVEL